jgi:pimeloyl-ACP methyl ester carboxylesterase
MSCKNIVLLHGWGASAEKLKPLRLELQKLGWKVCVIKLPGFDLKPPKEIWGLGNYCDFVLNGAKKKWKNEKFYIFGHSFGGRIAIKTSLLHPKSLDGLILCASGGISRGNVVKRLTFFVLAKIGKIFIIFPRFADFWKRIIYKAAREHDYEKADGVMRQVFKKVISENLKPVLSEISVPTLVIWGDEDAMTPIKDAYFITKNIRGSKLKVYKKQGHKVAYFKAAQIAQEIEKWMQSLNY